MLIQKEIRVIALLGHCAPDVKDVVGGDGDLGKERVGMKLPTIEQVDGGVRVTVWRKKML